MRLTFNLDDLRASLVSSSYFSSDDPMEIDSISAAGSDDSDIQEIACYREQPAFSETSVASRQMTIDTANCLGGDAPSLWPEDEFIEQLLQADYDYSIMGAGPPIRNDTDGYEISRCAGLHPIPDSPISPPLHERVPNYSVNTYQGRNVTNDYHAYNSHIQGISIRVSNRCGEPNFANYGDCVVCGRSYEQIKEMSALTFLESTTTSGESYAERQRRREAFVAGMETGTVLLVPRGLSQAAACDGNYYQIPEDGNNLNPMPGVLPI